MAYMNNNQFTSGKSYLNDNNNWENINLISTPETIRILLFKECRLRDRQLIFDSQSSQNVENKAKDERKTAEEFSLLTEMIFGSTAMKYHDTYYKIHGVSTPDRLIFTQVFSTPNTNKYQENYGSFFSKSNINFQKCSSLLEYDLTSNYLSQSSMDSSPDCFSIFRKNTSTNSTSTTVDSGFSDSSFSSNASFQPSYGSFTRSAKLGSSKSSLNFYNSFVSDVDSSGCLSQNLNYSRLGLALIVPVTKTKEDEIYMQHFTTIESILWRIRHYVELALGSPKLFFATMFEISSISAKWLSKELNFWTKMNAVHPREESGGIFKIFSMLNLRKSIFFRQKVKDERFEKFCKTLNEFDVKETKFFLSALLTAVLTHHTGWITSCYLLKEINLKDSYHAVWRQLTNLCGASGFLTKTSKTVIYGLKNNETLNDILDFLCYFIRYFRVERQYLERDDILEDNRIINDICDGLRQNKSSGEAGGIIKKARLIKTKKICADLSQIIETNKENYFNENDNSKLSKNKLNDSNRKGLSKSKTFGKGINILSDFNEESDFGVKEEFNEKSVLFILGDNDKLQNLKKSLDVKNNSSKGNIFNTDQNDESNSTVALKVIKFPLPKSKYIGDISEIIPLDFLSRTGIPDMYIPHKIFQSTNAPEKKWKNSLKNDLSLKYSCLFPNQLEENIAILANVDKWEVQVLSSNRNKSEGTVDSCPLVSNVLEIVLEMWKLNMAKEHCASFMEQRLVEICLKANALSQFLLTTDFCTTEALLSTLNLNIADVPLLMSVGSNINPEILQKYGLSYH